MSTYRYYSYDVWGNAENGYDVNDVFRTSETVEIPDGLTDEQLYAHLQSTGFAKQGDASLFSTDDGGAGDGSIIYLEYEGKPEGELRLENSVNP